MNKKDVQKRVSQNGKPLARSKFTWCEKTKTFASDEDDLVLDFNDVNNCTFDTGPDCTFDTGSGCTFKTSQHCTFKTGWHCTFKTSQHCTFKTGWRCTFDTGSDCTFDTGPDCTFDTGPRCTFDTGPRCTFKTGWDCTFKTGWDCVIVRSDIFEVIQPGEGDKIQLCPLGVKGHLTNGMYEGKPHIIADGILSEVVHKKDNVMKIIIHGQEQHSWLATDGDGNYAHGKTLREATEELAFKVGDRDIEQYRNMPLDTTKSPREWAFVYRMVTGACRSGTEHFLSMRNADLKPSYTLQEILEETRGSYGHETFKQVVT